MPPPEMKASSHKVRRISSISFQKKIRLLCQSQNICPQKKKIISLKKMISLSVSVLISFSPNLPKETDLSMVCANNLISHCQQNVLLLHLFLGLILNYSILRKLIEKKKEKKIHCKTSSNSALMCEFEPVFPKAQQQWDRQWCQMVSFTAKLQTMSNGATGTLWQQSWVCYFDKGILSEVLYMD